MIILNFKTIKLKTETVPVPFPNHTFYTCCPSDNRIIALLICNKHNNTL